MKGSVKEGDQCVNSPKRSKVTVVFVGKQGSTAEFQQFMLLTLYPPP